SADLLGSAAGKRSVLAGCVEKEISGNGCVKFSNMYRSCRTGLGRFAEVRAHHWGDSQRQNMCLLRRRGEHGIFCSSQVSSLSCGSTLVPRNSLRSSFASQLKTQSSSGLP